MKENVTWTTSLTTQQRDTGAVDHTHTTGDTVVGGRNGADYSGLKLKSLLPSSLYLKIVYKFISIFTGLRLGVVEESSGGLLYHLLQVYDYASACILYCIYNLSVCKFSFVRLLLLSMLLL